MSARSRFPLLTLVLVGVVALLHAFDGAGDVLEYRRDAVLEGEIWRIVTGNLVHWSLAHLVLDAGAFLAVGWLFETRLGRAYPLALAASAVAVGSSIVAFAPEVDTYRGLSGVASGQFALAALALALRARTRAERRLAHVVLAVFVLKIGYETMSGSMLFGTEGLGDIGVPLGLAHFAGALAGFGVGLATRGSMERSPPAPLRGASGSTRLPERRLVASRGAQKQAFGQPSTRSQSLPSAGAGP